MVTGDDAPWYDRFGAVVTVGAGPIGGTGGAGLAGGGGAGPIVAGPISDLHDLEGGGLLVGGSAYDVIGGAFDIAGPSLDKLGTDEWYTSIDASLGAGGGAEVHVMATNTWVLTLGDILRLLGVVPN